jgi:hypothetical protein
MMRGRKKVVWKEPEVARVKTLALHPYVQEVPLASHLVEQYMVSLVPGGLFLTANKLLVDERYDVKRYARHDFSYVYHDPYAWTPSRSYPVGSIAVYVGQVRVDEQSRTGEHIRPTRHSFIVGGIRYLTANLNDFVPVTSANP